MAENKENQLQVYEVVHSSPEIKTVGEYIRDLSSPAFEYRNDVDAFLAVKQKDGRTNKQVIFASYTTQSQVRANEKKQSKDLTLKVGTRLAIEMQKVSRGGLLTEGIEVISNDIPAFKAKALADLEAREGYTVIDSLRPINGQAFQGITKEMYPDVTVWVWCKSLSEPLTAVATGSPNFSMVDAYQGQIFNLTPFLQKTTTSITKKGGGNFQLTLPPLLCELDADKKWIIKPAHLNMYTQNENLSLQRDGYIAEGSLYSMKEGDSNSTEFKDVFERNTFLFHNIIGPNDLVFIRFETLDMEREQRINDSQDMNVDKESLAGRIYDMIGMVDTNTLTISPESTDVTINISGRDLSKLFIEDGSYFYPIEFTQGKLFVAGGATNPNSVMYRVNSESALYYLGLYFNNSIERVFKFVIQQLSTIKVCPDELFNAWAERRNVKYNPENRQVTQHKIIAEQLEKLEAQAKEAIKVIRQKNGLAFQDPTEEKVKIDEIFREQKRFLEDIRAKKVRKVEDNETRGWMPFQYINERGVPENIEENSFSDYFNYNLYDVRETRVVDDSPTIVIPTDQYLDVQNSKPDFQERYQEELASGIWQIIKLVIDEGVASRRLIDSSISTANGSLLNFFQKVCQEPFVEFYMDTYGDQYFLIARKPPHDRAGYLSMLKGTVTTEVKGEEKVVPAVVTIKSEDVIQETLSFNDGEAISWYHITPRANLYGRAEEFALAYFPAIYFPEYADIWGSKPMQLFHNYLPNRVLDPETSDNLDIIEKQAIEDLRYMIESTAYLPFTRSGTIVTNGDRRYKVGNLIRYEPTGEVFYIEGVQQTYIITADGIERLSTLQVNRGMVEQFIYGWPGDVSSFNNTKGGNDTGNSSANYFSYFNIINTVPNYSYINKQETVVRKVQVGSRPIDNTNTEETNTTPVEEGNSSLSPIPDDRITQIGNRNIEKLNTYAAREKAIFTRFINAINLEGYWVDVISAKRSFEEQKALYAQDHNNARPGHSRHETGRAIDINLIDKGTNRRYLKESPKKDWIATGVPQIAATLGLRWASGDGNFYGARGVYVDRVHFEIPGSGGNSSNVQTEPIYEDREETIQRRVLNRDQLFNNFRVNKAVFDFFMRRQQMSKMFSTVQSNVVLVDPNDDRNVGGVIITNNQ